MSSESKHHPLHRWFAALIETSFQENLGVCSPPLLDYLTCLLTDFIHVNRINLLEDGSGRKIEDVADMLSETCEGPAATAPTERRLMYHRHIGDFTLFWTGVYPENIRRLRKRQGRDDLIDFFEQGKRSYAIASRLSTSKTQPSDTVLRMLSDQFEYCVYGLGLVRKQWEQGATGDAGPLDLFRN